MAKKPTVTTVTSGYYGRTALNDNFTALRDGFDNTLSLDGSTPNAMGADLDMNSNDVLNAKDTRTSRLFVNGVQVSSTALVNDATVAEVDTVSLLVADTNLTYTTGQPRTVAVGDYVRTVGEGFVYEVAASGATDQDVTTAGGVKLYVQPTGDGYNLKAFGAAGDGTDCTAEMNSAVAACRLNDEALFIPAGTFLVTDSMTNGAPIDIAGTGRNSIISMSFSTEKFLFTFNAPANGKSIRDISITGAAQYSTNENFIQTALGYNFRVDNVNITNMGHFFDATDLGFTSYFKNIRGSYVVRPFVLADPNNTHLQDIYIQRFRGVCFELTRGLSPRLTNITCEFGEADDGTDGGIAVRLSACQSYAVDGLYTEGGTATDIQLFFASQRACVNGSLRNLWLNSGGSTMIDARSVRGLTIENVTMQTPQAAALIDFSNRVYSDGDIYITNVAQVDQNFNSFIGDVYNSSTQTLIPLSTDNSLIQVIRGNPKVGDGSDSDNNNIANHTQPDSDGRLAPLFTKARFGSPAPTPSDLDCTSGTGTDFGLASDAIKIYADDYGACRLRMECTFTNSAGNFVGYKVRSVNSHFSFNAIQTVQNSSSGGTATIEVWVNLKPGENEISLQVGEFTSVVGDSSIAVSSIAII